MNQNLIEIGFTEKDQNGTLYPYWVWIDTANDIAPIAVAEGRGFGGIGCNLTPNEVLSSNWKEHFNICGCNKLIEIVISLNKSGSAITASKIKAIWFGQ